MSDALESDLLSQCFKEVTGLLPTSILTLSPHASERRMYRLQSGTTRLIGVINKNPPENEAFIYFARLFRGLRLPVPQIHLYKPESHLYIEEDLGDVTLLDQLQTLRSVTGEGFPADAVAMYERVLDYLPRFQIEAASAIDFNRCYPTTDFSAQVLRYDMRSFAGELVGRLLPQYPLDRLDRDFCALSDFLMEAQGPYFLYRDFQARNIMLVEGAPYFIDFQGGRRGPLQYDVVSLLYQSSAQIPDEYREGLVSRYLDSACALQRIDREEFHRFYTCFIVSRLLQVLGVYGKQGLGAGKEYFKRSIPFGVQNLVTVLTMSSYPITLPELTVCARLLQEVCEKNL